MMLSTSPSQRLLSTSTGSGSGSDLADQIQRMTLADRDGPPASHSIPSKPSSVRSDAQISADMLQVTEAIAKVRSLVFTIQEQRHQNHTSDHLQTSLIAMDEHLQHISDQMHRLDLDVSQSSLNEEHENDSDSDSGSSDTDSFILPLTTSIPQRHAQLTTEWHQLQQETSTLKKELIDDQYLLHFKTANQQANNLMNSLEKALQASLQFISDYHANSIDTEQESIQEQLNRIQRQFQIKRNYYTPACEQTFVAFDHSIKQRNTVNGSLLNEFTTLKTRWKEIKHRASKVDKQLQAIQQQVHSSSHQQHIQQVLSSSTSQQRVQSSGISQPMQPSGSQHLPSSSPPLPMKSDKRLSQSLSSPPTTSRPLPMPALPAKSARRVISGQSPSPSSISTSPSLNSIPLPSARPPPASARSHLRSTSISNTNTSANASRPTGTSARPLSMLAAPSATPESTPSKRTSAYLSPSRPPSSFRYRFHSGNLGSPADRTSALAASSRSKTPQPASPHTGISRNIRGGSEPPDSRNMRSGSEPPAVPRIPSAYRQHRVDSPAAGGDDSMEYMDPAADLSIEAAADESIASSSISRPSSVASSYQQQNYPQYYRPPSAAGNHDPSTPTAAVKASRRTSRIPTYTFPTNLHPSRPSSSLSQSSHTTTRQLQQYNRSSMQTPEPMIAARVQRLNMFSKPSTGGQVASTSAAGKRSSGVFASSRLNNTSTTTGRRTPLSASALAKVPHGGPVSLPGGGGHSMPSSGGLYSQSNASGSVASYRLSKQNFSSSRTNKTHHHHISGSGSATPHTTTSSMRDGAVTPTFSESAFSSHSQRPSTWLYKPNRNDILDVSISSITNSYGIPLTSHNEPLPPHIKRIELKPGNEIRGRYSFGSDHQVLICKVLELHKSSTRMTAGDPTARERKVLVKVPGKGFLDLEVYLLGIIEAQQQEQE
ncbi:unnamed protein product [Sympodiomycopsis kandeliae]